MVRTRASARLATASGPGPDESAAMAAALAVAAAADDGDEEEPAVELEALERRLNGGGGGGGDRRRKRRALSSSSSSSDDSVVRRRRARGGAAGGGKRRSANKAGAKAKPRPRSRATPKSKTKEKAAKNASAAAGAAAPVAPPAPVEPQKGHANHANAVAMQSGACMPVPDGYDTPAYVQYDADFYHRMRLWGRFKDVPPPPQTQQQQQQQHHLNAYPIHPDVRFKPLPFYDTVDQILKPSTLYNPSGDASRLQDFKFNLTPQQIEKYANEPDVVSLQLRFCLLETSCDQEDIFPPSLVVKVNGRYCPLPMPVPTNKIVVEPKRPPGPVNITPLATMSPMVSNMISLTWKNDFGRQYTFCLSLVKKLTSAQLLARLKNKGTKHSDFTRSLIKEKLREDLDCEIATTSLRVSLQCPLGKMRMACPCRSSTCSHLQCFDASLFLLMNERKSTWVCPVCDKPALYDNLVVDGYFQDVLNSSKLEKDCTEIQLHKDGSWSVHLKEVVKETVINDISSANIEIINDDADVIPVSDSSESNSGPSAKKRKASAAFVPTESDDVVDLLSDDSDDDLPLKRKVPNPAPEPVAIEVACDPFLSTDSSTMLNYNEFAETYMQDLMNERSRSTSIISLDSPSPPETAKSPPIEIADNPPPPPPAESQKPDRSSPKRRKEVESPAPENKVAPAAAPASPELQTVESLGLAAVDSPDAQIPPDPLSIDEPIPCENDPEGGAAENCSPRSSEDVAPSPSSVSESPQKETSSENGTTKDSTSSPVVNNNEASSVVEEEEEESEEILSK